MACSTPASTQRTDRVAVTIRPATIDDIEAFLRKWLPSYHADGRHYVTVALGCTGGQHRSVYVAEELARRFRASHQAMVRHRSVAPR